MVEIDRIKLLAKENGVSLSFLCSKLEKQRGYLKDISLGRGTLSENQLEIIANALGTTPDYLHGKTDIKKAAPVSEGSLSVDEIKWLNVWRSFTPQEKERYLALFQQE